MIILTDTKGAIALYVCTFGLPAFNVPSGKETLVKHSHQDEKGFTLIEILVVILIIGVLASIALPIFINQKRTANEVALTSDLNNMAKAVNGYYAGQNASKPTKSLPENPDNAGWAILARHEGTSPGFAGDPAKERTYNAFPENFPVFHSSQGVSLGVKDSPNGQRQPGDFCIVGNADTSDFESSAAGTGANQWKSSMFFDSKTGQIIESNKEISPTGACAEFKAE